MLKKGLFFFLMTLLVLGLAAPALAVSTMTGEVNFSNFSIGVVAYYDGSYHNVTPTIEYRSRLYGEAYNSPYEIYTYDTSYQAIPTSIVFNEPNMSWIKPMSTSNNTTAGQMSAQFSGVAGCRAPDGIYAGGLNQNAFIILHAQFTVPAYVTNISVNLGMNYSYSVSIQNAASGNYFVSAGLGIAWSIYNYDVDLVNNYWALQPIIADLSGELSPGQSLVLTGTDLFADTPPGIISSLGNGHYEFWVPISVGQAGGTWTTTSPVPLPPTVLLLGSGLLGLAGWRRFRKG